MIDQSVDLNRINDYMKYADDVDVCLICQMEIKAKDESLEKKFKEIRALDGKINRQPCFKTTINGRTIVICKKHILKMAETIEGLDKKQTKESKKDKEK